MALTWRARAALFKGLTIGAFGVFVLGRAAWSVAEGTVAALGVFGTSSSWPDLAVAAVMGVLALMAARSVMQQAWAELHSVPAHA